MTRAYPYRSRPSVQSVEILPADFNPQHPPDRVIGTVGNLGYTVGRLTDDSTYRWETVANEAALPSIDKDIIEAIVRAAIYDRENGPGYLRREAQTCLDRARRMCRDNDWSDACAWALHRARLYREAAEVLERTGGHDA